MSQFWLSKNVQSSDWEGKPNALRLPKILCNFESRHEPFSKRDFSVGQWVSWCVKEIQTGEQECTNSFALGWLRNVLNPYSRCYPKFYLDSLTNRVKRRNYDFPEDKFRRKHRDYQSSSVTVDAQTNESVILWQVNFRDALSSPERLRRVESGTKKAMGVLCTDCRTVPILYGVCLIGAKMAFYTLDTDSKIVFNENGQQLFDGE